MNIVGRHRIITYIPHKNVEFIHRYGLKTVQGKIDFHIIQTCNAIPISVDTNVSVLTWLLTSCFGLYTDFNIMSLSSKALWTCSPKQITHILMYMRNVFHISAYCFMIHYGLTCTHNYTGTMEKRCRRKNEIINQYNRRPLCMEDTVHLHQGKSHQMAEPFMSIELSRGIGQAMDR